MNIPEDTRWQNLLAAGAPTFAGETGPPFGFTTRVVARVREEKRQRDLMERIGVRALLASLGLVLATTVLTVVLNDADRGDLEPGLRSIVQVENVPVS